MIISVRAIPKASCNKISELSPNNFKIWVTAGPSDGEANRAVIQLLSKHLSIPKSKICIKKGLTNRNKLLEIKTS